MKYLEYTNAQEDISGLKKLNSIIHFIKKNWGICKISDVNCETRCLK